MTSLWLAADLAALAQLPRQALAERWVRAFNCPAPGCRASVLRLALGWQIQIAATGPAGASPERLLKSLRGVAAPSKEAPAPARA